MFRCLRSGPDPMATDEKAPKGPDVRLESVDVRAAHPGHEGEPIGYNNVDQRATARRIGPVNVANPIDVAGQVEWQIGTKFYILQVPSRKPAV